MQASEVAVRQENNAELMQESIRSGIASLEEKCRAVAEHVVALEVMHHFMPGIYVRTCLMKAGDIIVGKIHKKEHLVIVSAGRAQVLSEEFGAKEIVAPAVFKSPPGVKRALLVTADCVWSTIHENPTNTQDLSVLEEELIAKDYTEVKV